MTVPKLAYTAGTIATAINTSHQRRSGKSFRLQPVAEHRLGVISPVGVGIHAEAGEIIQGSAIFMHVAVHYQGVEGDKGNTLVHFPIRIGCSG